MLKHVVTRLAVLPRWSVLAGTMTVIALIFCWQMLGLIAIQRGDFIDDNTLKLKSAGAPTSGMQLEQIATLHLFGDVAVNAVAPPMPTVLPKTDLKLVLVGAMTDSDSQKASALIQAENQTRRFYVGDDIPGGAVLHEVLVDSVVLKRNDRYETLLFPRASDAAAPSQIVTGSGQPLERTQSVAVAKTVQPKSPIVEKNIPLREQLQHFSNVGHPSPHDQ